MTHRSRTPIVVGIVGPGLIGGTFIKQLAAQVRCTTRAACADHLLRPLQHPHTKQAQGHALLQTRSLQNDLFIDMHVIAIISTRAMYLYNQKGCDLDTWQTDMAMGVSKQHCVLQIMQLFLVAFTYSDIIMPCIVAICWLRFSF